MNANILLRYLHDAELDIFEVSNLPTVLNIPVNSLISYAETLVRRGSLHRIEKGKYVKGNFRNEYVISNFLVEDGVIAYWTALNLHGLTEQFSNTIFVQTAKQKNNKNVFGVDYKFIKVKPQKMVGVERQGYGNHQFRITDKEKTIVDCFDLPQYAGGYEELIRAFAVTKLNTQKLISYCTSVNNIAVIKRMGYLSELFHKEKTGLFQKFALRQVNEKYSLLDPLGPNEGKYMAKWRLRINLKEDEILAIPKNLY